MSGRGVNKQPGGFYGIGPGGARQRRAMAGTRQPDQVTEDPIVVRKGKTTLALDPAIPWVTGPRGLSIDLAKLKALLDAL